MAVDVVVAPLNSSGRDHRGLSMPVVPTDAGQKPVRLVRANRQPKGMASVAVLFEDEDLAGELVRPRSGPG